MLPTQRDPERYSSSRRWREEYLRPGTHYAQNVQGGAGAEKKEWVHWLEEKNA